MWVLYLLVDYQLSNIKTINVQWTAQFTSRATDPCNCTVKTSYLWLSYLVDQLLHCWQIWTICNQQHIVQSCNTHMIFCCYTRQKKIEQIVAMLKKTELKNVLMPTLFIFVNNIELYCLAWIGYNNTEQYCLQLKQCWK